MMNSQNKLISVFFVLILAVVMASSVSASILTYDYKQDIVDALNRHDTAQALTLIDGEINNQPNFAPLYLLKGQIFYQRKQYDQALEQFDKALDVKSKLYEALYYRGLIYLEQDKLKEAKKDFDLGLKKAKEEKAWFYNGLGLWYIKNKEYGKADVEFRKAIVEQPKVAEFYANLGDANYYSKIYPLAISEYNKVIEMDTTFLDVYFRLARAYVAQDQYNKALEELRVVLVRDSMYAYAWKEAGKLYTLAGLSARDKETKEQRFKETIGSYRKFLELTADSSDGEVFFNLGRAYYNLGGFADADSAFEYVLAKGDVPSNIYLYLGRGKIGEEKYQEGIDYYKKHLAWLKENDPDWTPSASDADIYRRMGDAYKDMQDYMDAAQNYETAADLDTTSARYAVEAALAFHQMKDFPEALKFYDRRIALGPDSPAIYLNAAYCLLNMEDYEQAVGYLAKIMELDSTNVKACELLADSYLNRLGDCENGIKWMNRSVELDPGNCDALKYAGLAYLTGTCPPKYMTAVGYFKRALECYKTKGMDNCGNSDVMLHIAQSYHLQAADLAEADKKAESKKNFKEAYDWYNKVLKCDPGNAEAKKGVSDTEFEY